jgi:predicted nucleotidyltransferase
MKKFGLSEETIQKITHVFAQYPSIEKVIIYGSRAKGNYKNGSDIDLTFIGNNISDKDWTNLYFDLDDLLTPYTFDLSMFSTIENQALIDHIERIGKIFYEK